ncbi:MAG TPA: hypothetical protein VK921_17950 [Anditalea sp.]|nr:hypothetical protein [Anditalea sp.]
MIQQRSDSYHVYAMPVGDEDEMQLTHSVKSIITAVRWFRRMTGFRTILKRAANSSTTN